MWKLQIVYHQYHVEWWAARGLAIAAESFEKQHDVSIRGICSLRTMFGKHISRSCIPYFNNMYQSKIHPPLYGMCTNKLSRVVKEWPFPCQDYQWIGVASNTRRPSTTTKTYGP